MDNWLVFFLVFDYWFRVAHLHTQVQQNDMQKNFVRCLASHRFFSRAGKVWLDPDEIAGVRYQRSCGCCYAFTTCDVISSRIAIKYGYEHVTLAPQCMVNRLRRKRKNEDVYYNVGCGGANGGLGYTFAKVEGLVTEQECPYRGHPAECLHDDDFVTRIRDIKRVKYPTFERMKELLQDGPVCAKIKFYESLGNHKGEGIYTTDMYEDVFMDENLEGNHRVVVIGYSGDDEEEPYLIIKNSWGPKWGFYGYAKVDPALLTHVYWPLV